LQPTFQIAENAGASGKDVIAKSLQGSFDFGYNAANDQFEPLLKAGIADATKVLLTAARNAGSVTDRVLNTYAGVEKAIA
jgi:chaperonin GroEL